MPGDERRLPLKGGNRSASELMLVADAQPMRKSMTGRNVINSLSRSGPPVTGWIVAGLAVTTGELNLPSCKSEPVLTRQFDVPSSSEQGLYLVLYASSAGGL